MALTLLPRRFYKAVTCSPTNALALGGAWMQKAEYQNFPRPPNYDHITIPTERQKLRYLEKVPQYIPGTKAPKMTRRLDLIQGEEEVQRDLLYGQYGIIAKRGGMIKWGHIEMIRMGIARKIDTKMMFAIWRIDSPWLPRTKRGQGKRMGGGKGPIDHYVTPIKAERIIIEMGGKCAFEEVRPLLYMIAEKLPFPAKVISKEILDADREEESRMKVENVNPYTFKYIIQNNMTGCDIWLKGVDRTYFGKYPA